MNKEQQHERIEQYLAGSLSEKERKAFDQELQEDAALAKELELHRSAHRFLGDTDKMALKQKLEIAYQQMPLDEKQTAAFKWWRYGVAAAIIGLIAVSSLWIFVANPSGEALFAEHFQPYPAYAQERQADSDQETPLEHAFKVYEAKEYKDALPLFEQARTAENQFVIDFYLGVCHLSLESPQRARPYLNQVVEHGNNFYTEQATWYLALSFVLEDRQEEAIALLKKVESDGLHPKRKEAKKLLEVLKD